MTSTRPRRVSKLEGSKIASTRRSASSKTPDVPDIFRVVTVNGDRIDRANAKAGFGCISVASAGRAEGEVGEFHVCYGDVPAHNGLSIGGDALTV
ncbi:MAG: hypothetical protein R3E31_11425 [Chloroflexota bacterium]